MLDPWNLAPLALIPAWLVCHQWYKRIHGCRLRWWAVPFSHGALLFDRRLPDRWEKPWR